jgi:hypothetical protein
MVVLPPENAVYARCQAMPVRLRLLLHAVRTAAQCFIRQAAQQGIKKIIYTKSDIFQVFHSASHPLKVRGNSKISPFSISPLGEFFASTKSLE